MPPARPRKAARSRSPAGPKVTILGIGQMALVCAGILTPPTSAAAADTPPPDLTLWAHNPEEAGILTQTRRSDRLPGFTLPDSVHITPSEAEAVDGADLIVSALPVQFTRGVWDRLRGLVAPGAGVVSVAKGIENRTLARPTQIITEALGESGVGEGGRRAVGVLSGPTIAAELARCLPATMIAASDDEDFALRLQRLFSTSWLRIYTSDDVVGVELAGAVKNVIAIAAGILDGLGAGNNAKSALLARGLAEITRLGAALGARQETFFGIAGVGDLATSCFSPEGRNRSLGEALGRGERLDDYLARTRFVVEGVATTRSVVDLAQQLNVDMPITESVHAVLFEGMDPIEGIGRLMSRELKRETVG